MLALTLASVLILSQGFVHSAPSSSSSSSSAPSSALTIEEQRDAGRKFDIVDPITDLHWKLPNYPAESAKDANQKSPPEMIDEKQLSATNLDEIVLDSDQTAAILNLANENQLQQYDAVSNFLNFMNLPQGKRRLDDDAAVAAAADSATLASNQQLRGNKYINLERSMGGGGGDVDATPRDSRTNDDDYDGSNNNNNNNNNMRGNGRDNNYGQQLEQLQRQFMRMRSQLPSVADGDRRSSVGGRRPAARRRHSNADPTSGYQGRRQQPAARRKQRTPPRQLGQAATAAAATGANERRRMSGGGGGGGGGRKPAVSGRRTGAGSWSGSGGGGSDKLRDRDGDDDEVSDDEIFNSDDSDHSASRRANERRRRADSDEGDSDGSPQQAGGADTDDDDDDDDDAGLGDQRGAAVKRGRGSGRRPSGQPQQRQLGPAPSRRRPAVAAALDAEAIRYNGAAKASDNTDVGGGDDDEDINSTNLRKFSVPASSGGGDGGTPKQADFGMFEPVDRDSSDLINGRQGDDEAGAGQPLLAGAANGVAGGDEIQSDDETQLRSQRVSQQDLQAAAGHHHGHHHGHYYQYVEVPKKKAWKFGFKRGNHKHTISRHEKGYKNKFHSSFKWHAKEKCKKKEKCASKGKMSWHYEHHDKKHHH